MQPDSPPDLEGSDSLSPLWRLVCSLTPLLILKVQTACSFVETCMQPDSPPDLEGSDSLFPLWRLVYSLTPLLPPWSGFLRATEMLSPGVRVLNVPTKKNHSLLAACDCNF